MRVGLPVTCKCKPMILDFMSLYTQYSIAIRYSWFTFITLSVRFGFGLAP